MKNKMTAEQAMEVWKHALEALKDDPLSTLTDRMVSEAQEICGYYYITDEEWRRFHELARAQP